MSTEEPFDPWWFLKPVCEGRWKDYSTPDRKIREIKFVGGRPCARIGNGWQTCDIGPWIRVS